MQEPIISYHLKTGHLNPFQENISSKPLYVLFSVELAKHEPLFYDMYVRETVPNPARLQTPQMSKSFWGFLRRAGIGPTFSRIRDVLKL